MNAVRPRSEYERRIVFRHKREFFRRYESLCSLRRLQDAQRRGQSPCGVYEAQVARDCTRLVLTMARFSFA